MPVAGALFLKNFNCCLLVPPGHMMGLPNVTAGCCHELKAQTSLCYIRPQHFCRRPDDINKNKNKYAPLVNWLCPTTGSSHPPALALTPIHAHTCTHTHTHMHAFTHARSKDALNHTQKVAHHQHTHAHTHTQAVQDHTGWC